MNSYNVNEALKALSKSGVNPPRAGAGPQATIPTIKAGIVCPFCGGQFTISIQIASFNLAIKYPRSKKEVKHDLAS